MKILLIAPPQTVWENIFSVPVPIMPVGLAYIASYLKKNGYNDISILDAQVDCKGDKHIEDIEITDNEGKVRPGRRFGTAMKDILDKVRGYSPDLVGISCMFTEFYIDSVMLAEEIRKFCNAPVILGGPHASEFQQHLIRHPAVDMVIRGDGEIALLQIIKALEEGSSLRDVPCLAWKDKGSPVVNDFKIQHNDLDEFPMPSYNMLNMGYYIPAHSSSPYARETPTFPLITSRGCPMKCAYCTVKMLYGRTWRHRSAARIVDEIEFLKKEYGIREIGFNDDSISVNRHHIGDLCDELIKRKTNISWTTPNGIAHWTLNREIIKKMKKAGCYRLTFGIESGNSEMRKFIGKPDKLDQAADLIKYANRIGMWTICTFIIGFPDETREMMQQTARYALKCGTDMAVFYPLKIFPGTELHRAAKEKGLMDLEPYMDPTVSGSWIDLAKNISYGVRSVHFSNQEIVDIANSIFRYFIRWRIISFLNPFRLLRKIIGGRKDLCYGLKLFKSGSMIIIRMLTQGGRFKTLNFYKSDKEGDVSKVV